MYRPILSFVRGSGHCGASASLSISFFLLTEVTCLAGDVSTSGSTSSSFGPTFNSAESYEIETGVRCPTPTFNITGFAGNGNNSLSLPTGSAGSTDFGNYGIAVGLSIPTGRSLGKYCKDYAASVLKNHQQITQDRLTNYQTTLFNNCIAFLRDGINFENDVFKDERFSALSSCKGIPPEVWKKSANDSATPPPIKQLEVPAPVKPQVLFRDR